MTKKKKPPTDDEILAAIKECKNDLLKVAQVFNVRTSTIIRRLGVKRLKSQYRSLILVMAGGNVSIAARQLGIHRTHLHRLIDPNSDRHDPVVTEGWAEGRETRIDNAESKLDENINAGKEPSIFFFLKCQAKDRGYVERQEITGPDGAPVRHTVEIEFVKPGKQNGPTPRSKK